MSQPKYHTISVKSKNPDLPPTGANTLVLLDGVPLKAAQFVKIECHARRVTKVVLELYAHAEIEVIGDIEQRVVNLVPSKQ